MIEDNQPEIRFEWEDSTDLSAVHISSSFHYGVPSVHRVFSNFDSKVFCLFFFSIVSVPECVIVFISRGRGIYFG